MRSSAGSSSPNDTAPDSADPMSTTHGRTDLMPSTKKFSTLRERAERDAARAERIASFTAAALQEHAEYQLGELRRALGITQAELAVSSANRSPRSPRSNPARSASPSAFCARSSPNSAANWRSPPSSTIAECYSTPDRVSTARQSRPSFSAMSRRAGGSKIVSHLAREVWQIGRCVRRGCVIRFIRVEFTDHRTNTVWRTTTCCTPSLTHSWSPTWAMTNRHYGPSSSDPTTPATCLK